MDWVSTTRKNCFKGFFSQSPVGIWRNTRVALHWSGSGLWSELDLKIHRNLWRKSHWIACALAQSEMISRCCWRISCRQNDFLLSSWRLIMEIPYRGSAVPVAGETGKVFVIGNSSLELHKNLLTGWFSIRNIDMLKAASFAELLGFQWNLVLGTCWD